MDKIKSLNSLADRTLALLNYISHYDQEQVFGIDSLHRDFPFTKHLFEAETTELEDTLASLVNADFIVEQDVNLKTYKLSTDLDSDKVWPIVLDRLINIDRSFVRDRMLKLISDIPLYDFLELERSYGNKDFDDPFLSVFAKDQRVGHKDWWPTVCTLANLYDNVDIHGTVSKLLFHFAKTTKLKLGTQSDDDVFSHNIDNIFKERGFVDLNASVDNITPWKANMNIQVILVRWEDLSIERRDKIRNKALRSLLEDAIIAHMILPVGHPDKQDKDMLKSTQLIIFTPQDSKEIFINKQPANKFRDMLRERMDIELLSPYQITGFVPYTMFFGRHYELNIIAANPGTNYAIYGGRQSGKTSLMKQLERVYRSGTQNPAVFIDCELISSEEDFLAILCNSLGIKPVKSYSEFLAAEKKIKTETFLLVDEVDQLFATCDPKRVIGILRNLNEEYGVRCVLAGTTELYKQFRDINSPMYNFADPLLLGPLTQLEATELARNPMHSLGVLYDKGDSTVKQLINLCGRFPNLIQQMCHELVKKVKSSKSRTITATMLTEIFEGAAFGGYVVQQFRQNFNARQKLIVYVALMVKSLPLNRIVEKVQEFYDLSMSEIEGLLDDLELLFILKKAGKVYHWSYEEFPTILKKQITDLDFRIGQNIKEIKAEKEKDK